MTVLKHCGDLCGNWKDCQGKRLEDICRCLLMDLHEEKLVYVSNGSHGDCIIESLYSILREIAKDPEEKKPRNYIVELVDMQTGEKKVLASFKEKPT